MSVRLRPRRVIGAAVGVALIGAAGPALAAKSTNSSQPHLRTTSTAVNCNPSSAPVYAPTTCTVSVVDTGPGTPSTPIGSVNLTSSGAGSFSSSSCKLDSSGRCAVAYTPAAVGSVTITATYGGDIAHRSSQGSTAVTARALPTSTAVNCNPATVSVDAPTTCTATVTGQSSNGQPAPSGTVSFTASSPGSFNPTSCTLSSGGCQVSFTPSQSATSQVTATYAGDALYASSAGSGQLTVTRGTPTVLTPLGAGVIAVGVQPCIDTCGAKGDSIPIEYVRLTDDAGNPLANKLIIFSFCPDPTQYGGSPVYTDSNGIAHSWTWCTNIQVNLQQNDGIHDYGYSAQFPGDDTYAPSSASWTSPLPQPAGERAE